MALEIKYNGNVIATLEKGQTATIPCDGKEMATDLAISISASANLISFIIDGITYRAEEDMIWFDWCQSAYNTGGFYVDIDSLDVLKSPAHFVCKATNGAQVDAFSHIATNGEYIIKHAGGSN